MCRVGSAHTCCLFCQVRIQKDSNMSHRYVRAGDCYKGMPCTFHETRLPVDNDFLCRTLSPARTCHCLRARPVYQVPWLFLHMYRQVSCKARMTVASRFIVACFKCTMRDCIALFLGLLGPIPFCVFIWSHVFIIP